MEHGAASTAATTSTCATNGSSPAMVRAVARPRHRAGRTSELQAELTAVGPAVLALGVLHALHVRTGLRERDRVDRQRLAALLGGGDPAVDVALAAVVGGQRERLVAGVAAHQVAQVPG